MECDRPGECSLEKRFQLTVTDVSTILSGNRLHSQSECITSDSKGDPCVSIHLDNDCFIVSQFVVCPVILSLLSIVSFI